MPIKQLMQTTNTSVFNKTIGGQLDTSIFQRQSSGIAIGGPENQSRLSTISPSNYYNQMNSQALSNSGGNVVQIQRIKLVPVNEILNRNPFLNTESRLGSGHSPKTIQQSQRDSNNNVGSTILSKSLILSNNGGTQASRFQSTQRSSFLQGTVARTS